MSSSHSPYLFIYTKPPPPLPNLWICQCESLFLTVFSSLLCFLTSGALVISMHAYFNVYKRAQEGWNNFLLRRSAVKRLNSLQWATEEQLQQLNDVCCICYEELDSAKVTKCNHFFHSLCLRKWLYVQDKCPMCHADILPQD